MSATTSYVAAALLVVAATAVAPSRRGRTGELWRLADDDRRHPR